MRAFFSLLLCAAILLGAQNPHHIEIYAGSLKTLKNSVTISGDVVVVYGDYTLFAKRAKYDKQKGVLELFDGVRVSAQNRYKILGDYAKLDLKEKKRLFKPFYMYEERSRVWLSARKGCVIEKNIDISSGVVSGCDPKDPLWQIEFSSSNYNAQTKWLNLYNTVLYIYDIPVFYTPYFGYSLDTTRRTGLLTPSFGYSSSEGIFYQQPFYIAEQSWWDLEFDPQIRTQRGRGIYGAFRFVDSKYSSGILRYGYFVENSEYYVANNLANQQHYGINFDYKNSNFLAGMFGVEAKGQSVIYIETENMNDVDYINLATNDTTKNATPSQTISRANIFYNTDKNYFATYLKYYVDLTSSTNDTTLQQLPSLQYHRYIDTVWKNHLLYNFNVKSTYLYRRVGTKALETDFEIPITLHTTLFDEYLDLSYQTNLNGKYTDFQNENNVTQNPYKDGYAMRNFHRVSLGTQLTKPYKEYIHSFGVLAAYTRSGFDIRDGFYSEYEGVDCNDPTNKDVCAFYNISDMQESLSLGFSQYLFNKKGKQILYHRLSDIIADPTDANQTIGELESELDWYVTEHIRLYNDTLYNFNAHDISKLFNKIAYDNEGWHLSLSHFLKKNFTTGKRTSYVTSALSYRYAPHYSYDFKYDYDLENRLKKRAEIGFLYDKRCWTFGLRYSENNRPILTNDNKASSVFDRYIYVSIVLKPLMKQTDSNFFGVRLPKTLKGN